MEGLIATDWLKDYDPLFELFDEEMGAGQPFAQAQATSNCDYGFASDYYDTCAYHNYSSGSQYTGANQRPADELSLILGLDWMSGLELAPASNAASNSNQAPSPSRSLSSCASGESSCAPSPPAISTSAGLSAQTQCSSSASSSSAQPVVAPAAPVSVPVVQPSLVAAPSADLNENSGGVVILGTKVVSGPLKQTANTNQQQQRVFRIQLQNHTSTLNAATNNVIGHHGVASSLVGSNLISNTSGGPNGFSNTSLALSATTSSSVLKRKRRCIRTKGTSLLAQPSPKSNNSSNNSSINLLPPTNQSSHSSAAPLTATAPLSTLLTISKTTSIVSAPTLSQQVLPAVTMPTAATTTIITTPSATANLSPLGIDQQPDHHHYHNQRLQLHHNHHHQHPHQQCLKITNANNSCNNDSRSQQIHQQATNLTSLVRSMRYCVQIEHAYSNLSEASC